MIHTFHGLFTHYNFLPRSTYYLLYIFILMDMSTQCALIPPHLLYPFDSLQSKFTSVLSIQRLRLALSFAFIPIFGTNLPFLGLTYLFVFPIVLNWIATPEYASQVV